MVMAAPAPAAAIAAPTPSSKRQSSSLRMPVRFVPLGLTWAAVDRRADDTFGATVVSTASAASSRRGAAHSRAPRTASSSRGRSPLLGALNGVLEPRRGPLLCALNALADSLDRCHSPFPPGWPARRRPSRVRRSQPPRWWCGWSFIRDTVNLPSVIPLSQASRLCWVQSSRATGTVMTGGNLQRRNVRPVSWLDEESTA